MLAALSLQGPGEERTLMQLTADVFADIILDGVTPSGVGKGIRGVVNVTVPVLTLMGVSEEPGFLEGYGPIDPETARRIAAGAPSFTRILVHPETGAVLCRSRPNRCPNRYRRSPRQTLRPHRSDATRGSGRRQCLRWKTTVMLPEEQMGFGHSPPTTARS